MNPMRSRHARVAHEESLALPSRIEGLKPLLPRSFAFALSLLPLRPPNTPDDGPDGATQQDENPDDDTDDQANAQYGPGAAVWCALTAWWARARCVCRVRAGDLLQGVLNKVRLCLPP